MRAVILGGTGFIGTALSGFLLDKGWMVTVPSRSPEKGRFIVPKGHSLNISFVPWNGTDPQVLMKHLSGCTALVNLVGESIAAGRWTAERKERILASRVNTGKAIMTAFKEMQALSEPLPQVLVQASAVGYYGCSEQLKSPSDYEEFAPHGKGFLAAVARQWEDSTAGAESMGVRRVIVRTGVVLGPGGALRKFIPPFRMFLGGRLGSGNQGFSWIHRDDAAMAIVHLMENEACAGPYNLTAPDPKSMSDFCRVLGAAMNRPSWLPVPRFALRLLLGEMAEELILQGQYAMPGRLTASGYTFAYPNLAGALRQILQPAVKP